MIEDDELRVFFSGDSGYFDGFAEIGRRFGPADLTLMETGAYDPQWPYVHMQPTETVQAHQDLRGRWLLPIHNGTFDLAMHAWDDPFQQVVALAARHPGHHADDGRTHRHRRAARGPALVAAAACRGRRPATAHGRFARLAPLLPARPGPPRHGGPPLQARNCR